MLKPRTGQGSFIDADYICEQLIPPDSFYRMFRDVVCPLIKDENFKEMYCNDNGRPSDISFASGDGDHPSVSQEPFGQGDGTGLHV